MDNHRLHHTTARLESLSERISKAWKKNPASVKSPETLKVLKSILGVFVALSLAWLAKSETESRQRMETMNSEWPHAMIWSSWLSKQGWVKQNQSVNPYTLPKDSTSLPSQIWISRDRCLILLTQSPYSGPHPGQLEHELWSCDSQSHTRLKSAQWEKIGSGFKGVNRLAESIEKSPSNQPKKQRLRIDPREIHY